MSLIRVDAAKCCGDGACSEVCPLGLISLENDGAIPVMGEGNDEICVQCGHCVAVCSTGAMSHASCPASACEPLKEGWRLDSKQVASFLKGRRSVRRYAAEPVPKETLERLIEISRYAPTGQNAQSVSWLVLYNPDKVRELAGTVVAWMRKVIEQQPVMARALHLPWFVDRWDHGIDAVLRGAPHVVFAHGPRDDELAKLGSLMALTTFELAAQTHGLGTCWAGYAMMAPAVGELLRLPEGHQVFGAMMVGTPEHEYRRIPVRRAARLDWRL